VGSVRVGLAASDPAGVLASPVATLARDPEGSSDLDAIGAYVRETHALEVIVGLPRALSGQEGQAAGTARSYARELAGRLAPVRVRMVDERLTSVDAHRRLRQSGVSGRSGRAVVDQAAAVLILQSALDAERATGRPPGELVRVGRPGRRARPADGG